MDIKSESASPSPKKPKRDDQTSAHALITSLHPRVKQMSKSRLDFEIAPNMKIGVHVFLKTKLAELPTLKKIELATGGPVRMDRSYARIEDPDTPVTEKVEALRYGGEYVPILSQNKDAVKYETGKCLRLIGFFPADQFAIYKGISTADCIAAEPGNVHASIALSSLIHAMMEEGKVGLARFGARENSEPKLMVLVPIVTEDFECFYSVQMPFSEDSRESSLVFPSLPQPESDLLVAVDDLIDATMLSQDQLVTEVIPNPALDRFWRTVQARIEGEGNEPVAPVNAEIVQQLLPQRDSKLVAKICSRIKDIVKLEQVNEDDDPELKRRKKYWREIHERELLPAPSANIDVQRIKIESTQEAGFDTLTKCKNTVLRAVSENMFELACDEITSLGDFCIETKNVKEYNEFMKKLGETAGANPRLWREILRREILMQISKDDHVSSTVSREDALDFISQIIKKI
jgi:hypothetical protein